MEITLEKIELVKDRTGVSYKEAKEALEAADGSVVDAIIAIEESINISSSKKLGEQGKAVMDAIKDLIKKGNVSKIVVKKKDGEVMLCLPVNVGIVGVLVAPLGTVVGVVAAMGYKCVIEVVKTDGTVIDISDSLQDFTEKAQEKGSEWAQKAKEKGSDLADIAKEKGADFADIAKEKGADFADMAKEKGVEAYSKVKSSDAYDKISDAYEKTSDAVRSQVKKTKEDLSEGFEDLEEKKDEIMDELRDRADDRKEN